MKILVLGGAGTQGAYTINELIREDKFDEIWIGSRNLEQNQKFVEKLDSPKLKAVQVDVMDEDRLLELVKQVDIVANSTGPYYLLADYVLNACFEAGVHYIDLCDDIVVQEAVFTEENDKKAKEKDIIVMMGLGSSPGIFPVHGMIGANMMDEVDEFNLYLSVSNQGILSTTTVFDHMIMNMQDGLKIIKDGKPYEEKAFEGLEKYDFGGDIGEILVSTLGHPEVFSVPRAIPGVKNVAIKIGYYEEDWFLNLKELMESGFASLDELEINGNAISRKDFLVSHLVEEAKKVDPKDIIPTSNVQVSVKGRKGNKKLHFKATHISTGYASVGFPLAMAADLIADGKIKERGMLVPEEAIEPKAFIDDFARRMKIAGEHFIIKEEFSEETIVSENIII